jgi:hypothetical protein
MLDELVEAHGQADRLAFVLARTAPGTARHQEVLLVRRKRRAPLA